MNDIDYLDSADRLQAAEGLDPWTALMRVLVARLQGLDLPSRLGEVLEEADSHWSGQPADLREGKILVWEFLEELAPDDSDRAVPEVRAARALLCVLEPAGNAEDRSTTAEWFSAMVDGR